MLAEGKARMAPGDEKLPDDWTAPATVNGIDLPEVFEAASLAGTFIPHEVRIPAPPFNVQQIWGAVAVPVCRQIHIGVQSQLAAG
jgi:hypothetical protein